MGSRNSMFLPVLITTQEWYSHIHITNTSYKTINVTLFFLVTATTHTLPIVSNTLDNLACNIYHQQLHHYQTHSLN